MQVRFRYSGDAEWVYYKSPDNVQLVTQCTPVPGQSYVSYIVNYSYTLRRCYQNSITGQTPVSGNNVTLAGKIRDIALTRINNTTAVVIRYEPSPGNILSRVVYSTTAGLSNTSCLTTSPFASNASAIDAVASTLAINSITRVDGLPDNGTNKFQIKNSATNAVLYEQTKPTCPIAEVYGGCPPSTACQCDCGDTVCCYDATGKPIYSYPK